jgi:hypothetical protein
MLERNALKVLSGELDKDWGIHVAFGHLDTFTDGDPSPKRNPWPLKDFNWRQQMAHLNQLPYSSMMRREVFERSGGYRKRHWRAEDAAFWCRVASFGFRIKKVTQASTLIYRMRGDSKSNSEPGDGDWTAWYPWRIAGSPREGSEKIKEGYKAPRHMIPYGAPEEKEGGLFWDIPDREDPFVSVIVPVGPGHENVVIDALESLIAQTYMNWEVILVNDTGKELELKHAPYAKIVNTKGGSGPAFVRNYGSTFARGQTLLWLDADDYLMPTAIQKMVKEYKLHGPSVIYTDWLKNVNDVKETMSYYETNDFICGDVLKKMRHSVTCLVPHRAHKAIGGFDEVIAGWEDWDYFIALQDYGLCSYRIPEPLFIYRFYGGDQREESFDKRKELLQYVRNKWSKYYLKEEEMPCGGCKSSKPRRPVPSPTVSAVASAATKVVGGFKMVLLEYTGSSMGPYTIKGQPPTNISYKFGLNKAHKFKYVYPHDVEYFLSKMNQDKTPVFRFVEIEKTVEEKPVKAEDFVGQKVEEAPEPKPELEVQEPFVLDISMGDITIGELKTLLKNPKYLRKNIIELWIEQEGDGKQRKTVFKLLHSEYDKLS